MQVYYIDSKYLLAGEGVLTPSDFFTPEHCYFGRVHPHCISLAYNVAGERCLPRQFSWLTGHIKSVYCKLNTSNWLVLILGFGLRPSSIFFLKNIAIQAKCNGIALIRVAFWSGRGASPVNSGDLTGLMQRSPNA